MSLNALKPPKKNLAKISEKRLVSLKGWTLPKFGTFWAKNQIKRFQKPPLGIGQD